MINQILEEFKRDTSEFINRYKQEYKISNKIKLLIPNILTGSRLFTPILILPSIITGNFINSTIIAILLGLTDCFDGYLSRRWNTTSKFGQKLDAISDKVFAFSILMPIIFTNPLIISTLILEGSISYINFKSFLKGNKPKSNKLGKFKTVILYSLISLLYLINTFDIVFNPTTIILLTNLLQISTAVSYIKDDINKTKEKNLNYNKISNEIKIEQDKDYQIVKEYPHNIQKEKDKVLIKKKL